MPHKAQPKIHPKRSTFDKTGDTPEAQRISQIKFPNNFNVKRDMYDPDTGCVRPLGALSQAVRNSIREAGAVIKLRAIWLVLIQRAAAQIRAYMKKYPPPPNMFPVLAGILVAGALLSLIVQSTPPAECRSAQAARQSKQALLLERGVKRTD